MTSFCPHFEILPEAQKALWPSLAPLKALGFVLYGGTAVALYFGHRSSVDFDFFSHLPLDEGKDRELGAVLPFLREARLIQKAPDTRSYITGENVKHFSCIIPYAGITQIRCGRSLHFLSDCTQTPIYRTMIAQSSAIVKVGAWSPQFQLQMNIKSHSLVKLSFRS